MAVRRRAPDHATSPEVLIPQFPEEIREEVRNHILPLLRQGADRVYGYYYTGMCIRAYRAAHHLPPTARNPLKQLFSQLLGMAPNRITIMALVAGQWAPRDLDRLAEDIGREKLRWSHLVALGPLDATARQYWVQRIQQQGTSADEIRREALRPRTPPPPSSHTSSVGAEEEGGEGGGDTEEGFKYTPPSLEELAADLLQRTRRYGNKVRRTHHMTKREADNILYDMEQVIQQIERVRRRIEKLRRDSPPEAEAAE